MSNTSARREVKNRPLAAVALGAAAQLALGAARASPAPARRSSKVCAMRSNSAAAVVGDQQLQLQRGLPHRDRDLAAAAVVDGVVEQLGEGMLGHPLHLAGQFEAGREVAPPGQVFLQSFESVALHHLAQRRRDGSGGGAGCPARTSHCAATSLPSRWLARRRLMPRRVISCAGSVSACRSAAWVIHCVSGARGMRAMGCRLYDRRRPVPVGSVGVPQAARCCE